MPADHPAPPGPITARHWPRFMVCLALMAALALLVAYIQIFVRCDGSTWHRVARVAIPDPSKGWLEIDSRVDGRVRRYRFTVDYPAGARSVRYDYVAGRENLTIYWVDLTDIPWGRDEGPYIGAPILLIATAFPYRAIDLRQREPPVDGLLTEVQGSDVITDSRGCVMAMRHRRPIQLLYLRHDALVMPARTCEAERVW